MTHPQTAVFDLAPKYRPTPASDHVHEANAVLNQVLQSTLALVGALHAIANRHFDGAPASSEHVLQLTTALAHTVLDWIERWPS